MKNRARLSRYGVAIVLLVASFASAGSTSAQQARQPDAPRLNQPGKDVQWVPTPPALVEKMLDMAGVTPKDRLVDLGSGDGVLVIAAAKRGLRARGIEYDRGLVEYSKRSAAAAGVSPLTTFVRGDIFKSDFSDATVITTFLLPSMNLRLRPTFLAMKPGTRIVANTFAIGEWQPDESAAIEPCERWCTALLWVVPARVGGTWLTPKGDLTLSRRKELEAQLKAADEPPALLHPEMARIYRTKVTELAEALQQPESRLEATEALRGLVDAIVLTPNGSKEELGIELRGNLAAMLGATVQTKRSPESDDLSLQVSLVAGAGFEPATFGL